MGGTPKNQKKKNIFWKDFSYLSFFIFSLVLIFFSVSLYNYFNNSHPSKLKEGEGFSTPVASKGEDCLNCLPRLLDGKKVEAGRENLYPVAVIIDNHPEARPAFGLSRASLVYETEAEGQITRFLAFFDSGEEIDKIGPIRSARPYFLDWARELSALFVHCGGSPAALAELAQNDLINLNEFYHTDYFWRSPEKSAPHNIFTSSSELRKHIKKRGLEKGKFLAWNFKDQASTAPEIKHEKINIDFHNRGYNISWQYQKDTNSYLRFLKEGKHLDGRGEEIKAQNLIIQYTDFRVLDEELRLKIKTTGGGEAIICQNGVCRQGFWEKSSPQERTRYYYQNDQEVIFNPGATWVEVVRNIYKNDNIF